ncbi:MAG: L,D-transpeptidase family protein [Bdellovibrionales bacterium]|nr:L,D-transpeptidase family protein [Bdellovibrionales bacterium]
MLTRITTLALLGTLVAGLPGITHAAPTQRDLALLQKQIVDADDQAPAAATTETDEDNCPTYTPRAALRLIKQLPAQNICEGTEHRLWHWLTSMSFISVRTTASSANYDLSLGLFGIGKTKEGDWRTPTGTYSLAMPRPSDKFGIFMEIGYPTKEQREKGFTGGDVGIHGPKRMLRCAGFLNVVVDWTQGCLAVASDGFIKEIAQFVKQNKVKEITILPSADGSKPTVSGPKTIPSLGPDPASVPRKKPQQSESLSRSLRPNRNKHSFDWPLNCDSPTEPQIQSPRKGSNSNEVSQPTATFSHRHLGSDCHADDSLLAKRGAE